MLRSILVEDCNPSRAVRCWVLVDIASSSAFEHNLVSDPAKPLVTAAISTDATVCRHVEVDVCVRPLVILLPRHSAPLCFSAEIYLAAKAVRSLSIVLSTEFCNQSSNIPPCRVFP
jgi:hypothetical protein